MSGDLSRSAAAAVKRRFKDQMAAPSQARLREAPLFSRRYFLMLGVRAALVAGLTAMLATTAMAAGPLPQGRPSFIDEILSQVSAVNLREELSPEAQAFAVQELKISSPELGSIKTFLIPLELMEGLLTKEDNARKNFAFFYLYREVFEEGKDQILRRMNSVSREKYQQRLTPGDLEFLFASLQNKIFGTNQQKKQYAILIIPKRNEGVIVRDSRILHELKHHTQNLPVYLSAEYRQEVEAEACAFGMHYLAVRGLKWPEILETFVDVSGLTAKEARVKRKEFEREKGALLKIWEENVQPKLGSPNNP